MFLPFHIYRCYHYYTPLTAPTRHKDTVKFLPNHFNFLGTTNSTYFCQAAEDIISILSNKNPYLCNLHYLLDPLYSTPTYRLHVSCAVLSKNHIVRIPVSSPYVEVSMDTSGTYALVKSRTDTSGIYTPT